MLFQTLNNCFKSIRKCSTSNENWLETRTAFIDSAKKTNEAQKLGLNLHKCHLVADDFKIEDPNPKDDGPSEQSLKADDEKDKE